MRPEFSTNKSYLYIVFYEYVYYLLHEAHLVNSVLYFHIYIRLLSECSSTLHTALPLWIKEKGLIQNSFKTSDPWKTIIKSFDLIKSNHQWLEHKSGQCFSIYEMKEAERCQLKPLIIHNMVIERHRRASQAQRFWSSG